MEKEFLEEDRYLKAQKRVKEVRGFYMNLFWYLVVNIAWVVVVLYLDSTESFFQYGFWGMGYGVVVNAVFWGIGLFAHWFLVFGKHLTFSKSWEDRKVEEFMKKDKN